MCWRNNAAAHGELADVLCGVNQKLEAAATKAWRRGGQRSAASKRSQRSNEAAKCGRNGEAYRRGGGGVMGEYGIAVIMARNVGGIGISGGGISGISGAAGAQIGDDDQSSERRKSARQRRRRK